MSHRGLAGGAEARRPLMPGGVAVVPAVDVLVANIDGDVYKRIPC